jgi:cytoskeletal protein CcmA (bactofilin family)
VKNRFKNMSIIDQDLSIEGTLNSEGSLLIRGTVKGTLTGKSVTVAEEGALLAEVVADQITIGGKVEGNIQANEELIILSTGSCSGTVVCKNLTVESGGLLNANVTYLSPGGSDTGAV